jgi:hypothetical protein
MVQAVSGQIRRVLNNCENECGMLAVMSDMLAVLSDRLISWNFDSVTFCDRAMYYGAAKPCSRISAPIIGTFAPKMGPSITPQRVLRYITVVARTVFNPTPPRQLKRCECSVHEQSWR